MKTLASYYFLFYLAMSVLMPYTSLYFSERGYSSTTVGLILSLWALVSIVAQPIMGMINDRINNPRKILMICAIAAPVLGMGFQFVDGMVGIIVLSVFFAWFQSSAGPIGDSMAVEIASKKGYSFGSIRLWGALSYAIGTFATGIIYNKFGYNNIFIYYLIICTTVCIVIMFFPGAKVTRSKISIYGQMGAVIRNKPFMIFVVTSMLMMMSASINMNFLPLYFKEMGFNKSWIGSAFAIAALIEVPMFWVATKLSRKIGRYQLLCVAAAIYGVQYFAMFIFSNVTLTLVVQLLNGIAYAFVAGTAVEVVQSYATKGTNATLQTIYAAVTAGLGGIIGNTLGGIIIDRMGGQFLYLILFCLCIASSLLFMVNRHHQHHQQSISG
ncbi:MFS family permease [Paenibacillus anaericanus]|uniref:MFS transporter n=1 Tax=Paenibacillus anaericanus TaxID=170367 RepID=UPI002782A3E5|nr:MFS transporter [Paenibacillus anaericanus]MDQ0089525.1 MFS family permease [Paenibacillus anaericanus]